MGKKNKHSKDKLHKTVAELRSHHVDSNRELELSTLHRRLRFDTCCLTLDAITEGHVGLCDEDETKASDEHLYCWVFQRVALVKFLEKYQLHPITGKPVSTKSLIPLNFHKNKDDKYHCPIIYKLFNQHSKIVANKKTGHVYSYEAYQQLNLKLNSFKDLLTDEPFEKKDILIIQDPETANERWNVTNFYYVKNKLKVDDEDHTSNIRNVEHSAALKASLNEYKERAESIAETFNKIVGQGKREDSDESKLDKINSAHHSNGVLSRSVTSTVMPVEREQKPALLTNQQILYPRIKKKAYIQLMTNFGSLNLELFCDKTPKTCHNFLLLASKGYYDNTIFHRLIKNFILQGGDPTGTGSGGQSAWGTPFEDEFKGELKHTGRGVIAMANSGPNSNKSQFYIVLRGAWDHLDKKHTVFGRLVGGDDTLEKIEDVEVDKNDKPLKEVKIIKTVKYVDPFEEMEKVIEEERRKSREKEKSARDESDTLSRSQQPLKKFRSGVGAYIDFKSLRKNKSSLD